MRDNNLAFQRIRDAWAALTTRKNDPQRGRLVMVPAQQAGVYVDHDNAFTVSSLFRAVSYISQSIAGLPWQVIRERERNTTVLANHPIAPLLHQKSNEEMGAFTWRETMLAWALTWGNGYSEIEFDYAGRPVALWPISPDRVEVKRLPDSLELVYEVNNYQGGTSWLPKERVFHLHGLGFDGLVGYSVVSMAARTIGLSMAAERHDADFFANGTVSTGVIRHPKALSDKAFERLQKDFQKKHALFGNKWKPIFLEEGMEWQALSVSPEDSQLLETRKFQINDIARWFGLPPHKLADLERATFSNIEHQSIEVVNDALMPWVHRFEQEAAIKLLSGRERGIRTKMNVRGLLRGDDKSRAEYYQIMRRVGAYSSNDIRRLEDMDPVGPEGDELIVEANMVTLKQLAAGEPAQPAQPALPAPAPEPQQALLPTFEDIFDRILRRETGQFEQVSTKIGKDSAKFAEWADGFFTKHQSYMVQALQPAVDSLLALLPGLTKNLNCGPIIEKQIIAHIQISREILAGVAQGEPLQDDQARVRDEAKQLIEAVVSAAMGEIGHGQSLAIE